MLIDEKIEMWLNSNEMFADICMMKDLHTDDEHPFSILFMDSPGTIHVIYSFNLQ